MEHDVVCQMAVDPITAMARDYQGQTYYFCCEGCARAFLADPGPYPKHNTPQKPVRQRA
ncbi:YHS domain-containing protein [Sulfobacillus thermosulfidooxidans]|uniref:YHS domain-containing protein n=1 Tax=Sulfobacillus thermosulfidooxidans TaxID=28034 RepID=UPI000A018D95|nr:YHS domain-containing protein [Sulfobacillus thermosulfidooxidans]